MVWEDLPCYNVEKEENGSAVDETVNSKKNSGEADAKSAHSCSVHKGNNENKTRKMLTKQVDV